MFTSKSKRIISSVLALSFVLSIIWFVPNEVEADSFIELGQIYTVTEDDYKETEPFNGMTATYTFVPEETGYYSYEGTADMDFFILDEDSYYCLSDCYNDGISIAALNLPHLFENSWYSREYELEAGETYYITRSYDEYSDGNTGEFCIRKISDYVVARAASSDIYAVKDGQFTCSLDIESTIAYESVSFSWVEDYGSGKFYGSTDDPEKTFNSNDVIDFENSTKIDSNEYEKTMCCYIDFEWPVSTTGPRDLMVKYFIYPCTSVLAASIWANGGNSWSRRLVTYSSENDYYYLSDDVLEVDAGSDIDCNISYQWYEFDSLKEANGITDRDELYILLNGQTDSSLEIFDVFDEPYIFMVDNVYTMIKKYICVVTFDDGSDVIEKELQYTLDFVTTIYYEDKVNCNNIFINLGDTVSLPERGEIYEGETPPDVTYRYTWVGLKSAPEYMELNALGQSLDVRDYLDSDFVTLATGKTASIDTSKLPQIEEDGFNVCYVACIYEPICNNQVCYGKSLVRGYYAFRFNDVSSLSFEDSLWAEFSRESRSWFEYHDLDDSYYKNDYYEVDAGSYSSSNVNISYQWYKIDTDKELAGVTDKNELYIPLEGETGKKFYFSHDTAEPYTYAIDNVYYIYKDFVCIVTFDNGNETVQKELSFRIDYHTQVDVYDVKDFYVNAGDELTLDTSDNFEITDLPADVTYRYYWINLTELPKHWTGTHHMCSNTASIDEMLDVRYQILKNNKVAVVDTDDLVWLNEDGSSVSYVAFVSEPLYNGKPCFGSSTAYGFTIYKIIDISSLSLEDSVWVDADYFHYYATYHSDNIYDYTTFEIEAGSYVDNVEISYQWYKIDSDKESSGNYSKDEYYIPLEGCNGKKLAVDIALLEILGEPYFSCDEDNIASLYINLACIVTFKVGSETIQKEETFTLDYTISSYYFGNNSIYVKRGDKIQVFEAFDNNAEEKSLYESDTPDYLSYRYTWISLSSVPEFMEDEIWDTGDDIWSCFDNYEVLGYGKNLTVDTSKLPLFDFDEDKVSYIACVFEPVYNGTPVLSFSFTRKFKVFRIGYTDLVNPDTTGIAVNKTNFPDDEFRKLVAEHFDKNNSGYLSRTEIDSVQEWFIEGKGIKDLTGIKYLTALKSLSVADNELTSLDVSGMTNLNSLYCYNNQISTLIYSGCDLYILNCSDNCLTSLNMSNLDNLEYLYCANNSIKALNLSGLKALNSLDCSNNGMYSLNISDCSDLNALSISGNNIASIDLGLYENLKDAYENGPYHTISDGVSGYGNYGSNLRTNSFWIYYGIQLDNTTQVINATPASTEYTLTLELTQVEDGVKLTWNAIEGAVIYEIVQFTKGENGKDYYYETSDTSFVDKRVEAGVEYFYYIRACDKKYNTMNLMMEAVSIVYSPSGTPLAVTTEPEDFTGSVGEYAIFTVAATGSNLKYQWQYNNGSGWKNSNSTGFDTDTMKVKITATRDGQQYRCIVTSGEESVTSKGAAIHVKKDFKIITDPIDVTGTVGSYAEFTVVAEGEGLKYQWQYCKDGVWKNSNSTGFDTDTLKVKITATRDGQQYRCIVSSGEESVTSKGAAIHVKKDFKIISDPIDVTGTVGSYAEFTVVAEGDDLKYQWQYCKDGVWKNSNSTGFDTPTLTVKITDARNGQQYRCVVSKDTDFVTSKAAKIVVAAKTLEIKTQPSDYTGAIGSTATFTVAAEGDELTYQWQYKTASGSWKNSGSTGFDTATLSIKITEARIGQQYQCIIKDKYGNTVTTGTASIKRQEDQPQELKITSQPKDYTGAIGDTATFTVAAEGDELTYQWQYKTASGSWKNSGSSGYDTASLSIKITEARIGQQYQCIIKDKYGNTVTTDTASIKRQEEQPQPKELKITSQPDSYTGAVGTTATFTVGAEGEGLTYQWQYSKDGTTWKNSSTDGATTASLSIKVTEARNGQMYQCIVKDASGKTVTTDVVSIQVG